MKQRIINILLFIMLIGLGIYVYLDHDTNEHKPQPYVKLEQPEFLDEELSDSTLLKALIYYEINEPLIVLAQLSLRVLIINQGYVRRRIISLDCIIVKLDSIITLTIGLIVF